MISKMKSTDSKLNLKKSDQGLLNWLQISVRTLINFNCLVKSAAKKFTKNEKRFRTRKLLIFSYLYF